MYKVNHKLVEIRKRFKDYYNGLLRHKYEELEPIRQKYLKKFWFWFIFFAALMVVYVYFCFSGIISKDVYVSEDFFKIYVFYFAIAFFVCSIPISDYKKATKFAVMDRILDFWGDFKYSDKGVLVSRKYIEQSELFDEFTEQEQDDAFNGIYHGVEIKVSEQKLVKVIHTSKGRRDKTIFKGVLLSLHLNKKYIGNTIVRGRNNYRSFIRYNFLELFLFMCSMVPIVIVVPIILRDRFIFCNFFISSLFLLYVCICFLILRTMIKNIQKKMDKRVLLEDVVFSKKWKVYADDQIEARYILTPALMERMLVIKKLFHGNRLDFSFWDKNLLIAVHTSKDMFETTSLFKSALDYRKVQEVICQLYSIFSVIDVLKLQSESKNDIKKES